MKKSKTTGKIVEELMKKNGITEERFKSTEKDPYQLLMLIGEFFSILKNDKQEWIEAK